MINRNEVLVCVLARAQAEGKNLSEIPQAELNIMIEEAIADLRLAEQFAEKH